MESIVIPSYGASVLCAAKDHQDFDSKEPLTLRRRIVEIARSKNK
jgi:hypothetical protein